jgi:uncharacterized protein YndB with AHSA1/START domain
VNQLTEDSLSFTTSRVLQAPRDRVFAAFLDGQQLARWWGPKDFTNTFDVFEPRAGGAWRFTMHGPDGKHYPNESLFLEVLPDRIVFQHVSAPVFKMRITLEDLGNGQTRIGWHQQFDDAALREKIKHIVVPANEENLDRLEAVLRG